MLMRGGAAIVMRGGAAFPPVVLRRRPKCWRTGDMVVMNATAPACAGARVDRVQL